tara:strand:+ start:663 stop:1337 length:675 start_codon:yes stop_codon:yes gene_type:complete
MKSNMSQNKITVIIENQKLFETISEIIIQINKKLDKEFELTSFNAKNLTSQTTIVADSDALQLIESHNSFNNIKKIYLLNTTKDFDNKKNIKCELVIINLPFYVNEFFDRVMNDVTQEKNENRGIINFTKYNYDFNSRLLFFENKKLRFTEKENEIFACLINSSSKPVSKKKLLKDIWKYDDQIDTHTLETHIYSLRKKLESKLGLKNFLNHFDEGYQIDRSLL